MLLLLLLLSLSLIRHEEMQADDENVSLSLSVMDEQERCQLQETKGSSGSPAGSFSPNLSCRDSPSEEHSYHVHVSKSSEVSRCACQSSTSTGATSVGRPATSAKRRCQMIESFSLTEIRSPTTSSLTEFDPLHSRSRSVQGTMATLSRTPSYLSGKAQYVQQQHSRSDSSFNYESNISEMDTNKPVNYFEYRSLESITSPTISDTTISQHDEEQEEEEEEANSTRVNFDEGSTFTSPREEEPAVVIEDGLYSPMVITNHSPQMMMVMVNGEKSLDNVRPTPPPTPATTPVKSASSPPPVTNTSTCTFATNSSVSSKPSRPSSSSKKMGGKSKSARHRRRKAQSQNNKHASSNEDLSVRSGTKRTYGQQQAVHQSHQHHHADWSILPIFKQLIVQKQLECGGTQSQPITGVSDDERTTTTSLANEEKDEVHRQMSSCPNLSIKCDVVEYF